MLFWYNSLLAIANYQMIHKIAIILGYIGENCDTKKCNESNCHNGNCTDNGECQCYSGFSGDTCKEHECNGTWCHNGGLCKDDQCECEGTGHTGKSCEIKINFCQNVTCGPRQECMNMSMNYTCICKKGFIGPRCENENSTTTLPTDPTNVTLCENKGLYMDGHCDCNGTGYMGKFCEIKIDFCKNVTCGPRQECMNMSMNYTCICKKGFIGPSCENENSTTELPTDPTNVTLCKNKGLYVDGHCDCDGTGHMGKFCENKIDFCQNVTCGPTQECMNMTLNYTCICKKGFIGPRCKNENSATELPTNPTNVTLCNNKGLNGDAHCDCNGTGYTGKSCEIKIDFCKNVTCGPRQECMNLTLNYTCACKEGYTGPTCDNEIKITPVSANPNNATLCKNKGRIVDGHCDCNGTGYMGKFCEIKIDFCKNVTCGPRQECMNMSMNYTCICKKGFIGPRCENANSTTELPTDPTNVTMCNNKGQNVDGYCDCNGTGYTGKSCELKIDFCQNVTCGPRQECMNMTMNYTCICKKGFIGPRCENENSTKALPTDPTNVTLCNNKGQNVDGHCDCNGTGYTGKSCELKIDFCQNVTCGPRQECMNMTMNYTCICKKGFIGPRCENENGTPALPTDPTNVTLCNNEGLNGDGHCDCNGTGYTGKSCEIKIDFCKNVTCGPRQQCMNMRLNYTCECKEGYTGPTCENEIKITPVSANPNNATLCKNKGRIVDGHCDCNGTGYMGKFCEIKIDFCKNVTCGPRQECMNMSMNYTCICKKGFVGPSCENENSTTGLPTDPTNVTLCKNKGLYVDGHCDCDGTGHMGKFCDIKIDFCKNVTCGPRQQCMNMTLNYTCACKEGYTGPTCENEINITRTPLHQKKNKQQNPVKVNETMLDNILKCQTGFNEALSIY